jgi:hypothetical protein
MGKWTMGKWTMGKWARSRLAERVGFEPTVPCGTPDFESVNEGRYRPALPSKSTTYVITASNRQALSSYAVDTLLTLFRILLASMKNANYINTGITYAVNQDVVWMNDYFTACRHARTAYK